MTKKEYVDWLLAKKIDEMKVGKIQDIYGTELPDVVKKIISNNDESIFFDDDYRILSYQEVIDAKMDLHVDFKDKGIIPLVDCGENDFIVYHFNDGIWSKFNIVDETVFKKKNTIEELLE